MLGTAPELEPILLGAIFAWRGHGSWALTPERAAHVAELERRAERYALPPFVWPAQWPANSLTAMRAATWAKAQGSLAAFAKSVYRTQFQAGADISDPGTLADCANELGLDGEAMRAAVGDPALKQRLREATEAAWEAGVPGVPTVIVGERVFYGDDHLPDAAAAA